MRIEDLLDHTETLKKIRTKQEELDKLIEKKQTELGELIATLPASLRALLDDDKANSRAKSNGERRERITLSNDDKAAIRTMAKEVMKKSKDGMKFGEIMAAVKKQLPDLEFKDTHFRGILQNDKAFTMKGEKINALWFVK